MADPKIEVWSRDIAGLDGLNDRITGDPQHLYIVYTDENGDRFIIRGGPEHEDPVSNGGWGKVAVVNDAYTAENQEKFKGDWYDPATSTGDPHTLLGTYTGADATQLYQAMQSLAQELNSLPTQYSPLNDNSNTTAAYLLGAVGLEELLSDVSQFREPGKAWAPGSDGIFLDYTYDDDLISEWVEPFADAEGATPPPPRRDPLTLDLDGDGIETVGLNPLSYFDHDGNGFAEQTGWVGANDGLLVWDRNGDGRINDGSELFGDQTRLQDGSLATNGFQALAEWDTNADGKIDSNDAVWANLKVWQDADGDGYSAASELHTLDTFGITGINLSYTNTNTSDSQGNTLVQSGSFTKTDGSTGQAGGFQFNRDTLYTIQEDYLAVTPDIAALPDLRGYGNVYDLQQAMVRDATGSLKALVESFIAETNPGARNALLEQILFKWTNSDALDPTSRGGNFDARKLSVLEKFYGREFVGVSGPNPNAQAAALLSQSYQGLSEMLYA